MAATDMKTEHLELEKGSVHSGSADAPAIDPSYKSREERRLVLKQDLIMILYFMAYVDRGNLGNAKLQGLQQDVLANSSRNYQIASLLVYVGLVAFQVPGNILAKRVPRPELYIGLNCIGWGIASSCQAAATNPAGIFVARLFIGIFEACFVPSIPLYLSFYYTRREIGLRVAFWIGSALSAGAFAGLIGYAVQIGSYSLARWQVMFLSEGIPTVALGIMFCFCLPTRPQHTRIFNEAERALALERSERTQKTEKIGTVDVAQLKSGALDWRTYVGGIVYLGANVVIGSISSFLPTIVKGLGYSASEAQLYTVPPYAVAFVLVLLSAFALDHYQTRGLPIACFYLVSAVGYIMLRTVESNLHARYFAIFLILAGAQCGTVNMIGWVTSNAPSESKRALQIGALIGIGQIGGIIGSFLYPDQDGPQYHMGSVVCACAAGWAALGAIAISVHGRIHNARKDRKYGKPVQAAKIDLSEFEASPAWRYNP